MPDDRALTLLGFAAKAGRLSFGMDASIKAIRKRKSFLILAAGDVSEKSQKEIAFFAKKGSVSFVLLERLDIKTVSDAVGRRCGILSVNDSGFADAFLKAYVEGGNACDE